MNGNTIIAVIFILSFVAIREVWLKHKRDQEQEQLFDSARLQREIYSLYHAAQELERIDMMIIDLRLCKPGEIHKSFSISWSGTTGNHSLDLMSDGQNANTENLIAVATDRREEINMDIQRRIIDLYTKAQTLDFMVLYDGERHAQNGVQNDCEESADE